MSEKMERGQWDFGSTESRFSEIVFACGIRINVLTGKVTLPEGLTTDEAAKEFWLAVEKQFNLGRGRTR